MGKIGDFRWKLPFISERAYPFRDKRQFPSKIANFGGGSSSDGGGGDDGGSVSGLVVVVVIVTVVGSCGEDGGVGSSSDGGGGDDGNDGDDGG